MFTVEICHAELGHIELETVEAAVGWTVADALQASKLAARLDVPNQVAAGLRRIGIFGKLKTLDARLHAGDRIEIYRPLLADPMEARRRRVIHKSARR